MLKDPAFDFGFSQLNGNPLPWLLENDPVNPGVRYRTLEDVLERPSDDPEVVRARQAATTTGPVQAILDAQNPEGYWVEAGGGYNPKYRSSVWSVIFLAQLGADPGDARVRAGCEYMLNHARSASGAFSYDGHASMVIHCHQGNLCAALIDLGFLGDERLQTALDWLARSVTGDGIAPAEEKSALHRYYRSGTSGPRFLCSANNHKACAWGAVKTMLALGKVPEAQRTPQMRAAIQAGVEFLLSHDPALAEYPTASDTKPNRSWFQFGYPIAYVTDVLQNLEALAALGYARDPRLERAYRLILDKQDSLGRWMMEYTYNGKTLVDIEEKGKPSKWVTFRALQVLKPHFAH